MSNQVDKSSFKAPPSTHEAADWLPPMPDAEFRDLVDSIRAHGLIDDIELFGGQVIDGRHRLRALVELGVEWSRHLFHVEDRDDYDAKTFDPVAYVLDRNVHRRHLTESQRAAIAARLAKLPRGGDRRSEDFKVPIGTLIGEAAERLNVSPRSVKRAKVVLADGTPELVAAVDQGKVSVAAAAKVATLPKHHQREIVANGPKAVTEAAAKVDERADRHDHASPPRIAGEGLQDAVRRLCADGKPIMVAKALFDTLDATGRATILMVWQEWMGISDDERKTAEDAIRPTKKTKPKPKKAPPVPATVEADDSLDPVVLVFPTDPGTKSKATEWMLRESKVAEYRESFPSLDVLQACREARQWIIDHRDRRKTPEGMERFLSGWLTRNNNEGRNRNGLNGNGRVNMDPRGNIATAKAYLEATRNGNGLSFN